MPIGEALVGAIVSEWAEDVLERPAMGTVQFLDGAWSLPATASLPQRPMTVLGNTVADVGAGALPADPEVAPVASIGPVAKIVPDPVRGGAQDQQLFVHSAPAKRDTPEEPDSAVQLGQGEAAPETLLAAATNTGVQGSVSINPMALALIGMLAIGFIAAVR